MARRLLHLTLNRTSISSSPINGGPLFLSPRILSQRNRSSLPGKGQLFDAEIEHDGECEVITLRKFDDVIHSLMVKRSAPDWLPFIPGSSYWVPPSPGLVGFVGHVNNSSYKSALVAAGDEEEYMSLSTPRGWPSSAYFMQGASYTQSLPVGVEVAFQVLETDENDSRSEETESEDEKD